MTTSRPAVPASFFGMVLGLVGLGDCWRVAAMAWGYSHAIDEIVMGVAFLVWLLVLILYIGKWFWARDEAIAAVAANARGTPLLLLNNLPAASLLAARTPPHPYSLLIGLNLGPNLFVTGSLAWLIWLRAARGAGVQPSGRSAARIGVVAVPLSIAAAVAVLLLTGSS